MATVARASEFFSESGSQYDVALIHVIDSSDLDKIKARIDDIYLSRDALKRMVSGAVIEFVTQPTHWGNTSLKTGETAVVFLSAAHGRLYERAWHGHYLVRSIRNQPCVIIPPADLSIHDDSGVEIGIDLQAEESPVGGAIVPLNLVRRQIIESTT